MVNILILQRRLTFCKQEIDKKRKMELFTEIHPRLPSIGDRKICREGVIVLSDMIFLQRFGERKDPVIRPNRPVPHIETNNSDEEEDKKYFVKYIKKIQHVRVCRESGLRMIETK